MWMNSKTRRRAQGLALAGLATLVAAGCGSSDSKDPGKVAVKVTESGKTATVEVPAKVEGGAVELTLDNSTGKAPHSAQLVKVDEGHAAEEALKIIGSEGAPIPAWLRAEGGVPSTKPGETGTATVDLPEGHYLAVDDAAQGGKPAYTEFDVAGDNGADLPDADASITAAETNGDPPYEWKVDGLKAGENTFTFVSEGKDALHHVIAAPIKGDATIEDVQADLDSNGPPKSIDFENSVDTPVIDGGKSEVTSFNLPAGRYAFVCFLTDRDEPDKPHFKEGLLKEVTIGG
jgi:hypothetical protein